MRLSKSVALITGGAQGLGKHFAQNLLKSGTNVVIADIDLKAGLKFEQDANDELGEKCVKFIKCNVANSEELNETFEEAKSCFGRLDIVCNNAGIRTADPRRAREQIQVNLTAVVEGTYKGIELMSKQNGGDGGVVVNVASAAGIYLMKGAAVYTGTKHAVVHFTRSFKLLQNNSLDGVRINCICPFFWKKPEPVDGDEVTNVAFYEQAKQFGTVDVDDVVKAFLMCVENGDMNGEAIGITPPDSIYKLKYLTPVARL